VESIYSSCRLCFDQIPNQQNCLTQSNGRGPQTDKHLPPRPFTGQFLRKADIYDWSLLVIWSMGLGMLKVRM
jgi:hypothetical protein